MNTKLKEVFRGKVVNKAHTINTGVDEFPRYVLERTQQVSGLHSSQICFYSGQRLNQIGLHFGIGVSGVSQASRRVVLQIKEEKN